MNSVTESHSADKSVAVIGGGIIGICCALALREQGTRVTVYDYQGGDQACSWGNAGVLASWGCVPAAVPGVLRTMPGMLLDPQGPLSIRLRYLPELLPWGLYFSQLTGLSQVRHAANAMFMLHADAVDLYQELAGKAQVSELIRRSDFIYAYEKAEQINPDALEWRLRRERGARLEILTGGELREVEPDLSPSFGGAVVLGPQGHTINPGRLVSELSACFQRSGGVVVKRKINRICPLSTGMRIETDQGELLAEKVVVAAGIWSRKLLKPLGLDIPLVSERGYHCTFADPGVRANNTIMDVRRKFVANSMEQGLRCAGVAEFAATQAPASLRRQRLLQQSSKHLFPGLNTEQVSSWVGSRPSLPDSLPIIGAHPDLPDLLMAFGHSHTGLTAAPMTARLISELATGEVPSVDISAYRPDRFSSVSELVRSTSDVY